MRRIIPLLLCLFVASASAQIQSVIPGNTVMGNTGNTSAAPKASSALAVSSVSAYAGGSPVTIIYDDDPCNDSAGLFNYSVLEHWIDTGNVKLLALISGCNNTYAGPVYKVFSNYWGHSVPIGVYTGSNVTSSGNSSLWNTGLVAQFDPGDVSSNYPTCATVYRTVLASAAASSVTMIETGQLSCVAVLMASAADGISSLTGAQLIKAKVSAMYVMGGDYPTGSESNMIADPVDANYVFANWTSQNGYPNIYLNGSSQGSSVLVGRPAWLPTTDPAVFGAAIVGVTTRGGWDELSLYQGIFGRSAFTSSANGTNSVNSSTGANTWSSGTASGHYYLTLTNPVTYYEALLDGRSYAGAAFWQPTSLTPALQAPGIQCTANTACVAYLTGLGVNGVNTAGTVAPFVVNHTVATTHAAGMQVLDSALTGGQQVNIQLGVAAVTKNLGSMNFDYSASGSNSNAIGFGFQGTTEVVQLFADLHSQFFGPVYEGAVAFTVSGCGTAASVTGVGNDGTFTVGTGASTCTFTFTINGATGMTATHGWTANVDDTTAHLHCTNTGSDTTTTAQVLCNAAVTTADKIHFHADPY